MLLDHVGTKYRLLLNAKEMRYLQVALQNLEMGTRTHPQTNRDAQRMLRVIDDALPKGKVVAPK